MLPIPKCSNMLRTKRDPCEKTDRPSCGNPGAKRTWDARAASKSPQARRAATASRAAATDDHVKENEQARRSRTVARIRPLRHLLCLEHLGLRLRPLCFKGAWSAQRFAPMLMFIWRRKESTRRHACTAPPVTGASVPDGGRALAHETDCYAERLGRSRAGNVAYKIVCRAGRRDEPPHPSWAARTWEQPLRHAQARLQWPRPAPM